MQKLITKSLYFFLIMYRMLQVLILYVLSICFLCGYFPALRSTTYFYLMIVSLLCFVTLPILYIILDQNPMVWIVSFVFNSHERVNNDIMFRYNLRYLKNE